METSYDHFTCMPTSPTAGGSPRVIYSELPRGDYQLHASPFGINMVIEGEEIYEIEGARLRVRAGEMLVIDAGLAVRVIMEGRSINRAICVCLPHRKAPSLIAGAFAAMNGPSAIVVSAQTSGLGKELLRHRPCSLDQQAARVLIGSVVKHLPDFSRTLRQRCEHLPGVKLATRRSLLQRLERSYARLCLEGAEPASVQELARIAGMSPYHFTRAFRQAYGLPPSRLQQHLRMEAAASALTNGLITPSEAADRFGFADQASFTRSFRRHVGTSPGKLVPRATAK